MDWKQVGKWIQDNAGQGAALVGSLVTGNIPGAVAAGVSMISGATGHDQPDAAMAVLKSDPQAIVKLRDLYYQNEENVRKHIEAMKQLELEDEQKAQEQTQQTIRAGDNSQDVVVRRTRPLMAWCSLFAAFYYIYSAAPINTTVLMYLFMLPWAYAGLRQVGKGIDSVSQAIAIKKKKG